ncbi:cobalt ABC transporter ATP-binding protein [Mycoplasmopsis bovigenitalium]|uniref:Energy-coupling factor transporter ATP-binding protein EcfA2 n=1 Tax=Mycoplasmopsis bovigenitalium TaxID=2112 RepID=A0A449A914_9BACT|nr:energy-coupling factor transporter ATPase [Mycoplasmopsis bovigenitalium]VEU60666.1 cobalt ABC transporter ATP-binding protein [Mycoplasmopsis bovigenitalium]
MQIKIRDLSHTYNRGSRMEFTAIKNLNIDIKQGEFIGIIGHTGSGKSTFIEHLNALSLPTLGQINWSFKKDVFNKKTNKYDQIHESIDVVASWVEKNVHKNGFIDYKYKTRKVKKVSNPKEIRKRVAIAFQFAEYQLFEETIEKDIMFGPMSFGVPKQEAAMRAKQYLNLCGLDDTYLNKSPFGLSGGQKRRVALAGILAIEPDIIVADEPTAGLDPAGVREILSIFKKLHKMGKTIIIVTHDLDNILEVTDRVVIMKHGRIVKDGPTYDVLKDTEFLDNNGLQSPKLMSFMTKLEKKGWKLPKIKSIDELATFISQKIQGDK